MYRVFVFDLGNVIIPFDHSVMAERLIKYSIRKEIYSVEAINNFLYRVEGIEHLYEEGRITTSEFINSIRKEFALEISDDEFKDIFNSIFFNAYPDTERIIKDIGSKKLPLILLSNTNEMHFEFIKERYGIIKEFNHFLLSYKVGARKPDRRIYERLLEIARCSAEEIFYVDDVSDYVKAAKDMNISAFQFTSPGELYCHLKKLIT